MAKAKWERITAGDYRATLNGHELEVINHRLYTGQRSDTWNVLVDQTCDVVAFSKAEAVAMAERMATEFERR